MAAPGFSLTIWYQFAGAKVKQKSLKKVTLGVSVTFFSPKCVQNHLGDDYTNSSLRFFRAGPT